MTTTAQFRTQANDAMDSLKWGHAARLWVQAIEAYPENYANTDLGRADLAMMRKFADQCRRQADKQANGCDECGAPTDHPLCDQCQNARALMDGIGCQP